MKSGIGFNRK